ncbi:MAG: phosphomannomutase [Gemmatimonadales bacterium]|nr:phosphomannomutase [Gemmatimonadales bacterium]NIN11606.1 phosphomannomutase [Gemmatimonadales bacterium]NIN50212.1 phosphomannomutase [Gemmatimonadales bacterium]NIP07676.1 phosphomannomutase [Gemmatimonadales bacterium]NIR01828.1 phosphomannomutase [Gemmatimonadales bacterium]
MQTPSVIFREYDIRGVVGDELVPPVAHAIGRAVTTLARRRIARDPRLLVGRDNRPSGELLARAVRDGIAQAGGRAVDIGVLPTPALYLAQHELESDGGIQVTGSHNPPEFNGFKVLVAGSTLHGAEIQELRRLIETDGMDSGDGNIEADDSMLSRYADAVVSRNGPIERPVKLVVDCGNGTASLVAESVLSRLGADVVPLYCESDGTFPNHHPDPTVLENLDDLRAAVRCTGAELGIAFDGDGDRIGAVDESGTVVYGDQLLVLFGRDLVDRAGTGHAVIFDVKCSNVLAEALAAAELRPVIWKTGHSLIKAKMQELQAPLAGEMSGHMFFGGDYYGFDDALFAAARLLAYVARVGGPLSTLLADLPKTYATPELRVDCADDRKFAVVEAAARHFAQRYDVLTLDGARISYPDGWGLIRASNTQPVLVMRFESTAEDSLAQYRNEVETWLREQGVAV